MNTGHPLRIVLPGGNGQVGNILARHFHAQGHTVTVLARKQYAAPWRAVLWDGGKPGGWIAELENADVLINLAGRNVNCRYTAAHRREIMDSRVQSTRVLGEAIGRLSTPPRVWLNSSTATIYRHAFDRAMDEDSGEIGGNEPDAPRSWRFSIQVATAWEETFFAANTPRTRKVALRSSAILSPDRGGIFDVLLRLVRFGLGGAAGSGKQFVSWIHDADFASALDFLIAREDLSGIVNVASPHPLPNSDFMCELRRAWGVRIGLPASRWMLECGAFFLRTQSELVLKSRRVAPGRLLASGFKFRFPDWPAAAQDLVYRWRNGFPVQAN
ncbi:MAG TPA: TIGR01777 family oxidoreductase [Candidatus Acidoferrales bacterium]|nr:TIGR01777 family oxidoreductase [Candidatus Acidoferrales bacterium]